MHCESIFRSLSGTNKKRNEDNKDRYTQKKGELYQKNKFTVSTEHNCKQLFIPFQENKIFMDCKQWYEPGV